MPPPEDRPLRLLISFAPEDRKLKDQLVQHLQVLVRFAGVDLWEADRVRAGENWRQEAEAALEGADVALVLLSSDFLASNFAHEVEIPKLLQRREQGGLKVIPVLLRSCLWEAHPWLRELKPLPTSGQPIASFEGDRQDRALTEVAAEIASRTKLFDDMGRRSAVIEHLHVSNWGPVQSLDTPLSGGLNIIVGDNATGKSYLALALYAMLSYPEETGLARALSSKFLVSDRDDTAFRLALGPAWEVNLVARHGIFRQTIKIAGEPFRDRSFFPKIRREVTPAAPTLESPSQVIASNSSGLLFRADAPIDIEAPSFQEAFRLLAELDPDGRWNEDLAQAPRQVDRHWNPSFSRSQITLIHLAQTAVSRQHRAARVPVIMDDPALPFDERLKPLFVDLAGRSAQHSQVLLFCQRPPMPETEQYVVARLGNQRATVRRPSRGGEVAPAVPRPSSADAAHAPASLTQFDTKLDHTAAAAVAVGTSPQAKGELNMQGVTVHAETVIFAGAPAPGTVPAGYLPRPTPSYPDAETRLLGENLAAAQARKQRLQERGVDTIQVAQEILDLKRRLREGGKLNAGDSLGDGRYLLLDVLGRGGFATVWRAHDSTRGEIVAVKVLHSNLAGDPVRLDRFKRGARIMGELEHEAVVRVLDPYGEDGGYCYFAMEFVGGIDLHRAVIAKRLPSERAIPVILAVGAALANAHAKGIVHRDVKPANILLGKAGAPKLTDFDLVAAKETTGGTRTGALGTFLFTAPEQMHSAKDVDARADVYGLGMTAIFCLHGGVLPAITVRQPEKVIERLACQEAVKRVLIQAIEMDPGDRFVDARLFCEALREATIREVAPRTVEHLDAPSLLESATKEIEWLRAEFEKRPKIRRQAYKILTLGMKWTGKTSLTLKWANPLVDLGKIEGTKIDRYERTVSQVIGEDGPTEHVFEIGDWGGEHIVDAQQELIVDEIQGLLIVVDLGGKDAKAVEPARIQEQLREFQADSLKFFFGPKVASCQAVVLFINKSDLLPGTPAEAEEQAKKLYSRLIDDLMAYQTQVDIRVVVGSTIYGHSTHYLFSHFVEKMLPKSAYNHQLETPSNALETATLASTGNSKADAPSLTFVTNITGSTLPALAIGPGSQAHGQGATHTTHDSEELARVRLRAETAVIPFIVQHGSGFSPGDNMPIIGCVVENHGEKPFRIVGATGRWRFAREAEWNTAEFMIFQHRTAPGERSTVNAKLMMGPQERSKFDELLRRDPYQSPVEAEITVSCQNAAGYDGEDRRTVGWPVPPRPVNQTPPENWITSERPYVEFVAPPGWSKNIKGDWGVFKSPDGAAVFAFTTFTQPKDATVRLGAAAGVLGVIDIDWRAPKYGTIGRDNFNARMGEGSCNFEGPNGYIWYAIVDSGTPDQILLIYTVAANGSVAIRDAVLTSIRSLQRCS